ncbi:MarR family winged helix-turn-helix transcriptional regulator [Plantactinospora sp. WMMB334]|uniref:MarR family winged helix-turn-helix transcriptional regulator n=1 Tax=Plantactinospora sp. WMMB334 TaxID=3404119 RepID=UPI003B93E358
METSARHTELGDRLRDLMSALRMIRHRREVERPAVPSGMVGMLLQIDELAGPASGCHAKELADRSGLDPSTVSRAVATLVARGLVVRQADPADRRASLLAVTDHGRGALAEARDWYGDLLGRALAGWRPAEIEALSTALDRLGRDIQGSLDQLGTIHGSPDQGPGTINPRHDLEAAR